MGSYDELSASLQAALGRVELAAGSIRLEQREATRHAYAREAAADEHGATSGAAWLAHSAAHDATERLRTAVDALEAAASAADELARTLLGDLADDASSHELHAERARLAADARRSRATAAGDR